MPKVPRIYFVVVDNPRSYIWRYDICYTVQLCTDILFTNFLLTLCVVFISTILFSAGEELATAVQPVVCI
jgi:hypothetical protein